MKLDDQRHSLGATLFGIGTSRNASTWVGRFEFQQFMLVCEWTKIHTAGRHRPDTQGCSHVCLGCEAFKHAARIQRVLILKTAQAIQTYE
jgi:hypothetical protein